MTIYYLMVKTHNITGLKYLCQTKRKDPHKYLGSGVEWKKHLHRFGEAHTTEIIRECSDTADLAKWGRYYSTLWQVVTASADYGNKIWANLVPETGVGGGGINISGDNNYQRRSGFVSKRKGIPLPASVKEKISGEYHYSKKPGYKCKTAGPNNYQRKPGHVPKHAGVLHDRFNHTVYTFEYVPTGEIVCTTMNDLMNRYNLNQGNLSEVVSGKRQTVSHWRLFKFLVIEPTLAPMPFF